MHRADDLRGVPAGLPRPAREPLSRRARAPRRRTSREGDRADRALPDAVGWLQLLAGRDRRARLVDELRGPLPARGRPAGLRGPRGPAVALDRLPGRTGERVVRRRARHAARAGVPPLHARARARTGVRGDEPASRGGRAPVGGAVAARGRVLARGKHLDRDERDPRRRRLGRRLRRAGRYLRQRPARPGDDPRDARRARRLTRRRARAGGERRALLGHRHEHADERVRAPRDGEVRDGHRPVGADRPGLVVERRAGPATRRRYGGRDAGDAR